MVKKSLKLLKNQKGLTLVELLAVIVILGVIAAIAVPTIGGLVNDTKTKADKATETIIMDAAERYLTIVDPDGNGILDNGDVVTGYTKSAGTVTVAALFGAGYLKSVPVKQSGGSFTNVAVNFNGKKIWEATAVN